jgi:uncharacterized protein YggE
MKDSVKITLIICAVMVFLALIGVFIAFKFVPMTNTITANGMATIKVAPDLVSVYFNVETNGSTATIAKDKNSEITDKLTNAIVSLGFNKSIVQTQGYNIYPWQEWENDKMVDKGFKASHQIKIELKSDQMSKVGEVIDAGVNAGALISYINFELSTAKQNEYKALALKSAGEDAQIQAEATAAGVGKSLGRLVSVSTSNFNYYPWPLYNNRGGAVMAEAADAKIAVASVSITPSEQDVSASVSVVYALK